MKWGVFSMVRFPGSPNWMGVTYTRLGVNIICISICVQYRTFAWMESWMVQKVFPFGCGLDVSVPAVWGDDLPNGMWATFGLHLCQLRIGGWNFPNEVAAPGFGKKRKKVWDLLIGWMFTCFATENLVEAKVIELWFRWFPLSNRWCSKFFVSRSFSSM